MAFGLNRVFQKYFSNLFLTVIRRGNEWQLYSKVVKNGSMVRKFSKMFPVVSDDELGKDIENYIDKLYNDYNYVYVSYFLDTMGQGAITGVSNADFEKNSVDIKNVNHVKIDDKFSIYSSYIDINWVKNIFKNVGLDFIYSPFILTCNFVKKQTNSDEKVLYLLNHDDFISICVFQNEQLHFGAFFKTSTDEALVAGEEVESWEEAEEEKGIDNLIELDNISDNDEFSTLEDLDDIQDLDDIDISSSEEDSFEDIDEDKDKSLGHFDGSIAGDDLELFGRDLLVYKYLATSIQEYYKNPIYNGDFIDKVVFFDGYEISPDLIDMIENELMLDIEIHKVDLAESLCDLAIQEARV